MSDRDTLAGLIGDWINSAGETADEILAAGWRPPAQVIETPEKLTALATDTAVRRDDTIYQHIQDGWWFTPGLEGALSSEQIIDAADGSEIVVLYMPTETGDSE